MSSTYPIVTLEVAVYDVRKGDTFMQDDKLAWTATSDAFHEHGDEVWIEVVYADGGDGTRGFPRAAKLTVSRVYRYHDYPIPNDPRIILAALDARLSEGIGGHGRAARMREHRALLVAQIEAEDANDARQGIDRKCPACAAQNESGPWPDHSPGCPDSPEAEAERGDDDAQRELDAREATAKTTPDYSRKPSERNVAMKGTYWNAKRSTWVSVYDGIGEGLDMTGGRWQVVCERHGSILSVKALKLAHEDASSDPAEFCEDCREGDKSTPTFTPAPTVDVPGSDTWKRPGGKSDSDLREAHLARFRGDVPAPLLKLREVTARMIAEGYEPIVEQPSGAAIDSRTAAEVVRYFAAYDATQEEAAEVLAWVREWARDTFADYHEHDSEGHVLRVAHDKIEGGLRFVLDDVRRVARESHITTHPVFAALIPEARETIARNAPDTARVVVERQHSGSEDGLLWYVVGIDGSRISGDGHVNQEGAEWEAADIRKLAKLTTNERAAVIELRRMTTAPGEFGAAVLVADAAPDEYRYVTAKTTGTITELLESLQRDYSGAAGVIVTSDAEVLAIESEPYCPACTDGLSEPAAELCGLPGCIADDDESCFPTDSDGNPLAWPDPNQPSWYVDAWNGVYDSRVFALSESRDWVAAETDRVLSYGQAPIFDADTTAIDAALARPRATYDTIAAKIARDAADTWQWDYDSEDVSDAASRALDIFRDLSSDDRVSFVAHKLAAIIVTELLDRL